MLTVGHVSTCIPQVPIIVVFTKYDQLVIQKKFSLAESLADDRDEWERQAKETATEAVKGSCEKPLNAVAGNRHTWTEVSSVYYCLDDIYSHADSLISSEGRVQRHHRETDQAHNELYPRCSYKGH
jgi:hypothetical protein